MHFLFCSQKDTVALSPKSHLSYYKDLLVLLEVYLALVLLNDGLGTQISHFLSVT